MNEPSATRSSTRVEQPELVEVARLGWAAGPRRRTFARGRRRTRASPCPPRRPSARLDRGERRPRGPPTPRRRRRRRRAGAQRRRRARAARRRAPRRAAGAARAGGATRARAPARGGAGRAGSGGSGRRAAPTPRARAPSSRATTGAQPLDLGAQPRVGAQRGLERRARSSGRARPAGSRRGWSRAHRASSSSISSRRRASACTMRILTVPSGMPVAAAISRWLRPP